MNPQDLLRNFLRGELDRIRVKNPRYSLRAFSKKLDLSPTALSEVLNGRRPVTRKMTQKVVDRLMLPPAERSRLLALVEKKKSGSSQSGVVEMDRVLLESDQYHSIAEWFHYGILSLAETVDFQSEPKWIASRLGITEAQVKRALERLVRLGAIQLGPQGKINLTGKYYTSSDDVLNLSLRRSHATTLDLARESLENDPIAARDITSITVAIHPSKMNQAKALTRRYQDEMCALFESGEKTEVYKLAVQFFPLTKV